MVDCSKTIWILATNALDKTIVDYCKAHPAISEEDDRPKREGLLEQLTESMKDEFLSIFKVSMNG
jgi:hypothetical protein